MGRSLAKTVVAVGTVLLTSASLAVAQPRARDLGIPFEGIPGANNAITDVAGIEVGQTTLVRGEGALEIGKGPVRTGVTIIHPLGKASFEGVAAGRAVLNGTGEWTGMHLVDEVGAFFGPVALTGSGNVGMVHQSLMAWSAQHVPAAMLQTRVLPVVGETLESRLSDVFGKPMTEADVFAAVDGARGGPVAEGNVGGGTGMIAYGFKGGIGTSSRVVGKDGQRYTVGVLVQANHGRREDLRIAGVPVGAEVKGAWPEAGGKIVAGPDAGKAVPEKNSLLVVIATDAPLMPHQLERVARRAALGIGRNGSTAGNLSGEFALAFSTSAVLSLEGAWQFRNGAPIADLDSDTMNDLFAGTVQATEEALVNQLIASETMKGANDIKVHGLPHAEVLRVLKSHNRIKSKR